MESLDLCSTNYVPLTPLSFLEQASFVHGERVSIIYENTNYKWKDTHQRCLKLASALSQLGISSPDIVAAIAPNIPALYELHFAVPMSGGVLSALNPNLDSTLLASLLEDLEAKAIFVDYQSVKVVLEAFKILSQAKTKLPTLFLIPETDQEVSSTLQELPNGTLVYNELLNLGQPDFKIIFPNNECDPISVNYTSGSTGKPKGAIYSHRAAYLNSLAAIFRFDIKKFPVFLWTVDMFRCNGWCFTWAMAALGGTNICIRNVTSKVIFDAIDLHKVTHLCGAPTILNIIAESPNNYPCPNICYKVEIIVAGVLPPFRVLSRVEELEFNVTHAYGMTEALGPVIVNKLWKPKVNSYPAHKTPTNNRISKEPRLNMKFCIGVLEEVDVKDSVTMKSVPPDGKTVGEVMFRSNAIMSGYLKNEKKTQEAFKCGWYRTGDLGIRHPYGYIEIKDRAIDMIKSGEDYISTLEVEGVLISHPKVLKAAVVARSDSVFGTTSCAFVTLKKGFDVDNVTSEEIIEYCVGLLPNYMAPKTLIFGDLPVNSTGKIQKFVLRERVMALGSLQLL